MKKNFYIGLSVTYHDPALVIMNDAGDILFAEATERFLQVKRALNCEPDSLHRIVDLLRTYCDSPSHFNVAFNWKKKRPFYEYYCALADYFSPQGLMRERFNRRSTFLEKYKLFHMLACQTRSMALGGINIVRQIKESFPSSDISFRHFDHHRCHATAACYASPFEEAVCVIVDSFGEQGSLGFYRYREGKIERYREVSGIESLGFFYMMLTELCGFDWLKGEEWKVMGLAPYGCLDEQIYAILRPMISVEGLELKQHLDKVKSGLQFLEKNIYGREPMDFADLAYTGQYFFAELMESLITHFFELGFSRNLVLSGGCALNSSFNGQILQRTGFKALYIPSAPADDGTALGAAFLARDEDHVEPLSPETKILSPYLGSVVSGEALDRLMRFGRGLCCRHLPESISAETAKLLAAGNMIGWVQGAAEFGPRALGNRSILADPRDSSMKDKINHTIKFREPFRPFAPSILHEFGDQFFENYEVSPYMERTLRFREDVRNLVPAVVHVDFTGRLQTVKREWNARFYELIHEFYQISGVPILLNTSFNIMGKPIIHTIEDAVSVFLTTGLDALVIEDYMFIKPEGS